MRFPTAASSLSPEVEAKLTEFAQRLIAENKNVYLEIQGHTDSTGSPAENMRLGEQRADAVRRFLHKQGIAASRMSTIRSEEHTSELQSLMRISSAVFCLKKKKQTRTKNKTKTTQQDSKITKIVKAKHR